MKQSKHCTYCQALLTVEYWIGGYCYCSKSCREYDLVRMNWKKHETQRELNLE